MAKTVKNAEKSEEIVENEPKSVEKPEKMTIFGNPYLTDEQKSLLLLEEIRKILRKGINGPDSGSVKTLIAFEPDGMAVGPCYVTSKIPAYILKDAYALYKENIKGATVQRFINYLMPTYLDDFKKFSVELCRLE